MSDSNLDPTFKITTPRLTISHLIPSNNAHCDLTFSLRHSSSSIKFNPSGPAQIPDAEAARSFIGVGAERMARTGYGRFLVALRPDDTEEKEEESKRDLELIGVVSMQLNRHAAVPGPLVPDVGFNILPAYHGKGYATEAATHLMQYFRETRGVTAFAGITDEGNEEAKRLLARLGFRDWGVRSVKGVINEGRESRLSVWTTGVEDEGELEGLRL